MSLPVLTTLCPICYTSPPKYRCPRCSMRTCSLECSQAHKLRASCSGVRDPAKYIPKREMKPSSIDMDFNFLKNVQKTHDDGVYELQKMEGGKPKTSRRKLEAAKRKAGLKKARDRGVDVMKLPSWMERSERNKTKWNAKSQTVLWTVEWIVTIADERNTIIEDGLSDATILGDAFKKHKFADGMEMHYLLRKAVQPANGCQYIRLDAGKSLIENLKGLRIMEFPTINVLDRVPENWTVEEIKR